MYVYVPPRNSLHKPIHDAQFHKGHYDDAQSHKKALVTMLMHETSGAMSDFTAKTLHRAARDAKKYDCDGTFYLFGSAADSFVPYYAQKLAWAAVKGTALAITAALAKASRDRLRC